MNPATTATTTKFLAIAQQWPAQVVEADITSFNRHLCAAIARAGARIDCLVPKATAAELADAQALGVALIVAEGGDLNRPPTWSDQKKPDIIIGYGTTTGNAALMQSGMLPDARRVHLANEYLGIADDEGGDTVRLMEDIDLLRSAEIPAAIGPRGQREIATIAKLPTIFALLPGITRGASEPSTDISIRAEEPTPFRCVAVGDLATFEQSGLDIVAQSFAILIRAHKLNVALLVRTTSPGFADLLRDRIVKLADLPAPHAFTVQVVDPIADGRRALAEDLADASLFVMPQSTSEFGLVALEAIAAGVPVLVSTSSGIAEMLIEKAPPLAALHMVAVQRKMSRDATEWSSRMADELQNLAAARARAHRLRFALRSELTWDNTARALLERLAPDWVAPQTSHANISDILNVNESGGPASKKETQATLDDQSCQAILAAFEAARITKEPGAIGATLNLLVSWFDKFTSFDELHDRYAKIEHIFRDQIDLSLFKPGGEGTEPLALAAASVNFYRQRELSNDERLDWLDRIRALLRPTQYYAAAKIDLARAVLLSGRDDQTATVICHDAIAAAEQMQDPWFLPDALHSHALVLLRLSKYKEARAVADRAHSLFEQQRGSQHSLANIARIRAEIAVNQTPNDIVAASVFSAEAIKGYQATQDSHGEATALLTRAEVLFARNKGDEAIATFDRAVKLYDLGKQRTHQARALFLRSEYYAKKNNDRQAIRDLEVAEKFMVESPEKRMLLQVILAEARAHLRLSDHTWIVDRIDEMEEIALSLAPIRRTVAALVQICELAKSLPVPDKPRIRRLAGIAFEIAKAIDNDDAKGWAKTYLDFAG